MFLSDVSADDFARDKQVFRRSRWFTRGWTLQELLAPKFVEFFSREGIWLGEKDSLLQELSAITGISDKALRGVPLSTFSVGERFSWANGRETKREEDMAYSLLGLFDVHMPLIYGEGKEKALRRLRREISDYPKPQLKLSPASNVPFNKDPDFVDRPDILAWIGERCTGTSGARVALVGLGGIGYV